MSPINSQRADRRRRVLSDESRNESAPPPRIFRGDSADPPSRYTNAALHSLNAPIVRYLPLRVFSLVVWFGVGLIPVVGLLVLGANVPAVQDVVGPEAARALDLGARGNLAAWTSSVAFIVAIALMLGIFSVRRYRRDDYRGRFTVGRWGMVAALLVSLDATVGLHDIWQSLCEYQSGTKLWRDGSIWWVGTWAMLLGGTLARLMVDMISSRAAVLWSAAAGICYLCAGILELRQPSADAQARADMIQAGTLLLGHHLLVFSLVVYARHVVLEAMGRVSANADRKSAKPTAERAKQAASPKLHVPQEETPAPRSAPGSAPVPAPAPAKQQPNAESATPQLTVHADDDGAEPSATQKRPSRAEKRRQRKEEKRRKAA